MATSLVAGAALLAACIVAAVALRPEIGVFLVLAAAFVNPALLPTVEVARLDIRSVDVMCLIVGLGLLVRAGVHRERLLTRHARRLLLPIVPLVAYVGLSLATVGYTAPALVETSAVSFMRLAVTAAIAWMTHFCVRTPLGLRFVLGSIAALSAVSITIALLEYLSVIMISSELARGYRVGGLLGINSLGMVSGLLALLGVVSFDRRSPTLLPIAMIALGASGLFLSRSASSTIAAAVSVAVYASRRVGPLSSTPQTLLRGALAAVLAIAASVLTVALLRPDDLTGLLALDGGSFSHRVVVGFAGLVVFLQHPLVGVGWQASSSPHIIGSESVHDWLIRFANVPLYYLPRYSATSVHNLYVQMLAELGLIGACAAAFATRRIVRAARAVMSTAAGIPSLERAASFSGYGIGFLLIWWNTTPLYGGQIETFVFFALLGLLASAGRVGDRLRERQRVKQVREANLRDDHLHGAQPHYDDPLDACLRGAADLH